MATYKVIQNVEAEDKLVGPLTLRQFIYAGISALSLYLGFLCVTKHAPFMLVLFVPIALFSGFFAFPWGQDQPTEIWALAKIRFFLKPRKRIWDQGGQKELVTVTAPKTVERQLTNGLNADEVQSRLTALANTIDSRGWAVKNVNVNLGAMAVIAPSDTSDRLVAAASMPQEVSNIDVRASDDILDETANPVAQHFSTMINVAEQTHRQQLIDRMNQPYPVAAPVQQPNDWFMQQPATVPAQTTVVNQAYQTGPAQQPAAMTEQERQLIERLKAEDANQNMANQRMKILKTPEQLLAEQTAAANAQQPKPPVTPQSQAAIMNLANNDDLDVATIARQARKASDDSNGEVVIPLR